MYLRFVDLVNLRCDKINIVLLICVLRRFRRAFLSVMSAKL